MGIELRENERIDDLDFENLKIIQNKDWFCFGMDSVILANYASMNSRTGSKILDLGTGTGIIPILMSKKVKKSKIKAIEIQKDVSEMANRSVKLNNLENTIEIINSDIKDIDKILDKHSFDVVVTNPPYKKYGTGIKNENEVRTISRHEITANLEDFIRIASEQLKDLGNLYMINRPERIADIIECLRKYRLEPKEIMFIQPKIDKAPNEVVVKATKLGGKFLKVQKNLIIYNKDGTYTDEVLKYYGK